jgi:hypothetical protein
MIREKVADVKSTGSVRQKDKWWCVGSWTMVVSWLRVKGITHKEEGIKSQSACYSVRLGKGFYMMQVQYEETSMLQIR